MYDQADDMSGGIEPLRGIQTVPRGKLGEIQRGIQKTGDVGHTQTWQRSLGV